MSLRTPAWIPSAALALLSLSVAACDDDAVATPTLTPGQVLRVGSAATISQSGEYLLPPGGYTVLIECRGSVTYELRAAAISSSSTTTTTDFVSLTLSGPGIATSGPCSTGTTYGAVVTGPGAVRFTIAAGSVQVTLR